MSHLTSWSGGVAGGLGLEPRLHGSKGRRAADYPIPHQLGTVESSHAAQSCWPTTFNPMSTNSSPARIRMTGAQRRQQLLDVGRTLFAERGFEATSIEEIAARAKVSKPVVYEHFGGKEGLYAVVVDREMQRLLGNFTSALQGENPRELLEQAAFVLLDYIEDETDGFRILIRDSPVASTTGTFSSLISEIASQVEYILEGQFTARGFETELAGLYSQALVGMVALTGQWWLEVRKPRKQEVAAHLVNLAWNGLSHLEGKPKLSAARRQ